jgi:hypothetical protein
MNAHFYFPLIILLVLLPDVLFRKKENLNPENKQLIAKIIIPFEIAHTMQYLLQVEISITYFPLSP